MLESKIQHAVTANLSAWGYTPSDLLVQIDAAEALLKPKPIKKASTPKKLPPPAREEAWFPELGSYAEKILMTMAKVKNAAPGSEGVRKYRISDLLKVSRAVVNYWVKILRQFEFIEPGTLKDGSCWRLTEKGLAHAKEIDPSVAPEITVDNKQNKGGAEARSFYKKIARPADWKPEPGTVAYKVLRAMINNADCNPRATGLRNKDLLSIIGIEKNALSPNLLTLKHNGYADRRKKGVATYWRLTWRGVDLAKRACGVQCEKIQSR